MPYPPRNGEGDHAEGMVEGAPPQASRPASSPLHHPLRGRSPSPCRGGSGLIITADDFGASLAVNEAVEQAHRQGILTAASLMAAGDAAADAVARAKRLPSLGVGLHLVLVEGRPALPPERIPDLVDASGRFRANMALAGAHFFFRPAVRRQLADEIEAQFAAFVATGLPLDHVNAHKHFHLHPTIAGLILRIGRRYGLSAARAPVEPLALLNRIEPVRPSLAGRIAAPYARGLRRRFRAAGLIVPDHVLGLAWSGHMTADRLAGLIEHLPPGLTEIYAHPATADAYPGSAPGYAYRVELAALTDPAVRAAIMRKSIRLGRFADFTPAR
ncbi:MAG TPA: hopanoid biosynthesis-associated protein HpnK [Sphingomonas sp.]|nr:hopanoid biosynthesis-associated protein HpnK [Sphingomonas sp.]